MSVKDLRNFYNEFFNNHMFRDIDYLMGKWYSVKTGELANKTVRLRYNVNDLSDTVSDISKFKKSARYFLLNKKHRDGYGQLVHHNSYFKNTVDFHSLQDKDRLYDRLFFDIDKHDDVINGFKDKLKDIKARPIGVNAAYTYKQKLKDIENVHSEYQDYILNCNDGNFLLDPYNDVLKIKKYYNDRGVNPVITFTGGAGFHINVLFEPKHLNNPSDVFLSYTNLIASKTGVTSLDDAPPKNAVKGTQRTPYTVHEKSGLMGFIIPDDTSYDDVMTMIKRNKLQVCDFSYDDHLVPELLREQIIKMDTVAGQKKEQKKEQIKIKSKPLNKGKFNGNSLSDDLRVLWDLLVSDGMCEPVQDRDKREHYNRVRCPFPDHEDKTPSAICGKYKFKCFKCCPDGINWYMLIAVTYGIVSPNDINKNPSDHQKGEIKKVIRKLMGKS